MNTSQIEASCHPWLSIAYYQRFDWVQIYRSIQGLECDFSLLRRGIDQEAASLGAVSVGLPERVNVLNGAENPKHSAEVIFTAILRDLADKKFVGHVVIALWVDRGPFLRRRVRALLRQGQSCGAHCGAGGRRDEGHPGVGVLHNERLALQLHPAMERSNGCIGRLRHQVLDERTPLRLPGGFFAEDMDALDVPVSRKIRVQVLLRHLLWHLPDKELPVLRVHPKCRTVTDCIHRHGKRVQRVWEGVIIRRQIKGEGGLAHGCPLGQ
mmetsp:Transcript_23954/g.41249  ORF Transcript_23954/g.41249 Transcript_23954/m.41249 type:complete len:267 (-) Transcript_23954:624-1424(-)